jgi:hypothetical protein
MQLNSSALLRRSLLGSVTAGLLVLAAIRIPPLPAWQSALPLSRPGQEDLTFWVNHNGLEQIDVQGPVGFGDMARILMRRRSNAELMRRLRDRFTFKIQSPSAIETPDVFRVELGERGLVWKNRPERFVVAAGHTFNLPLIVQNAAASAGKMSAEFTGTETHSSLPDSEIPREGSSAYFLRVVEGRPGARNGRLVLRSEGNEISADINFDVRPLVNLRVTLVDENGHPAAARVYLTGADGLAYAPRGFISRIAAMGAEYYFDAEDSFELDLPSGKTLIEATCGQEYELTSRSVNLEPGKPASVQLQLRRWENMAAKGWWSSDAHIHANYTADHHQVITTEDIRLQARAEDINNANLMVANSGDAFIHDYQYFEGKPNALSTANFILYWNEEMRNRGNYGHLCLYNLKSLVYPLYTGFSETPYREDYPPNYAQADAALKQGGAVDYTHPALTTDFDTIGGAGAKELPVDLALGKVDAMDVVSNNDEIASMELWYKLLNCGFRLAISAGTDSFTNVADHYTPGGGRVYVHSGERLRYDEWIANYKRGRSFASNGPVIFFTVNGHEAGDELAFDSGARQKVRVKATVRMRVPLDTVEIVVNGTPVITRPAVGKNEVVIDEMIPLNGSAWIAARAVGPWSRLILNDIQAFAHSSPVYVKFGGKLFESPDDARFYVDWIERLITQTINKGRFTSPEHKQEVVDLFRKAQDVYRRIAN